MTLLEKVKMALRVNTDAYDDEIQDLICAAKADIGITDTNISDETVYYPLIRMAIITYVRMRFGQPDDYDRLKASYDEQKAQLLMSSDYRR